ncbi:hypothetical protein OTK01_000324 [Caldicellulosiruptor acetigenus]|uniref:hypothetical protein n=1 Tax=Caldicellulosiruptor acetigenus TaxID=301953 RepID=UPI0022A985C8|nr:hypothetical protein [Caldicellulosiruptor acetigenus]WAM36550.1 hypothetical protein OTK01_000324 [Caldicellulosiruptor acetigenus]
MSNNYSWFVILQRWWREQENEEIFEFEEGENVNMKWLRIKDEWLPVNKIRKIMIEDGILCYKIILEVQAQRYILSTFKKHEEAEEYVRQLLKAIIQQDIIEIETIQNT